MSTCNFLIAKFKTRLFKSQHHLKLDVAITSLKSSKSISRGCCDLRRWVFVYQALGSGYPTHVSAVSKRSTKVASCRIEKSVNSRRNTKNRSLCLVSLCVFLLVMARWLVSIGMEVGLYFQWAMAPQKKLQPECKRPHPKIRSPQKILSRNFTSLTINWMVSTESKLRDCGVTVALLPVKLVAPVRHWSVPHQITFCAHSSNNYVFILQ